MKYLPIILLLLISGSVYANDTVIETIAYESRGEPLEGQIAVACVIRQRAKQRGLTYAEVCLQHNQFSCWNKGVVIKPLTEEEYQRASRAWAESESMPVVADHYYAPKKCSPRWANSMVEVAVIGGHRFLKA